MRLDHLLSKEQLARPCVAKTLGSRPEPCPDECSGWQLICGALVIRPDRGSTQLVRPPGRKGGGGDGLVEHAVGS